MLEMFSRACKKSVIQNGSTLNRLNAFPKYLGALAKYAGCKSNVNNFTSKFQEYNGTCALLFFFILHSLFLDVEIFCLQIIIMYRTHEAHKVYYKVYCIVIESTNFYCLNKIMV